MAYVYRHIRLDKNEVFYIGIGNDNSGKYHRANKKQQRSKHWTNIANLGYEIEIIIDDLTWEHACQKEKELIKLYGRKDLNLGSLVNMTDGGEGSYNVSPESRKKRSDALKNREFSIDHKNKIRESKKGKSLSEYHIQKLKESHIGIKRSKEAKEKVSKSLMNNKNGLGYHHTDEAKLKISLASKNKTQKIIVCPHCNKEGGLPSMKRWHLENCKSNVQHTS